MKKILLLILIIVVCVSFAGCKDPESNNSTIKFDDIIVYVNSESGVQAGLHSPLIYIEDFEDYKSQLGVTLNVIIKDQDENEISLNEEGQFLVEYDKVYSINYTLSCEGAEPKNYFATVTALTSDMVQEPTQNEGDTTEEYGYLDFVTIDNNSCNVSAKTKFDNENYSFTLPKDLVIPSVYNEKSVIAVCSFASSYIETVELPASVITVMANAFAICEKLTDINIENVKSVKEGAFFRCLKLNALNLSSVETIEDEAFLRCSGLTTIDIGANLLSIGYHTFKDCTSLTSLTLRTTSVINLSETYLDFLSGVTVYVPQSVLAEYQAQNPNITFSPII